MTTPLVDRTQMRKIALPISNRYRRTSAGEEFSGKNFQRKEMRSRPRITTAIAVAGAFLLGAVSVWDLREPYYDYVWKTAFQGFAEVLPATTWAALKVWTFWGFATGLTGLILLRIDPELGLSDAIIGGAASTWIFAYVAGNILGPVGLFRSWTIWLIVIAAVVWIAGDLRKFRIHAPSAGQKLAILACLLMTVCTVPLELGSPVPPYMDVLNLPAAAQRILTFGRYLPFDNDPYGYWTPISQCPGFELFCAFLGFGSHTRLAILAVTGAMVPMAGLIIVATYRLGRALIGDVAGGMASLLLFATTLLMRAQGMHGTSVAFALVAIGLAFFFDPDRRPLRTGIGALAMATAVATHAIVGAFAFATAGIIVFIRFLEDDPQNAFREAACLVGAIFVTVPEFAVGLQVKLPYPTLPIAQLAGIVTIWSAAKALPPRPAEQTIFASSVQRAIIFAALALLTYQVPGISHAMYITFPILTMLCLSGLLIALVSKGARNLGVYVAALALVIAEFAEHLSESNLAIWSGAQAQFGIADVYYKLAEYWCPYFLVFPAAVLFDWIYSHFSKSVAVALLLALVVFPWSQHPELDLRYYEHSLAEEWAVNLYCAKVGWWQTSPDHRWAQSPAELALSKRLDAEILAGRITSETHIVHVTPQAIIWQDVLLHSVYTGIDDDIFVMKSDKPLDQGGYANGRMRSVALLGDALARNPPYIVVFSQPPAWMSLPPRGYEEIFHEDEIRLFRRDSLSTGATESSSKH